MRYRVESRDLSGFEELKRLDSLSEVSKSRLHSVRQQRQVLDTEVADLEEKWRDFKALAIRGQRDRAIGMIFKTFQLASGRKFQNVSVAAIDDAGVSIRHSDGSARLRFADLDSGQQAFFGLEQDLAIVAEEKEIYDTIAYERGIESQMAIIRQQEIAVSERARREEVVVAERKRWQQLAAQRVAAIKASPLSQPATRFGSRSWTYSSYYSNYRSYRPVYRYVYYNPPACDGNFRAAAASQPVRLVGAGRISPANVSKRKFPLDITIPFSR